MFSDFDGTILRRESLDILTEAEGGGDVLASLERRFDDDALTVRQFLAEQARHIRADLQTAVGTIVRADVFDETFLQFIAWCRTASIPFAILSANGTSLIQAILSHYGVTGVKVIGNQLTLSEHGGQFTFIDNSPYGLNKAAYVREARRLGYLTGFVGDGESDKEGGKEADLRFAKRDSVLAVTLAEAGLTFESVDNFRDVKDAILALG